MFKMKIIIKKFDSTDDITSDTHRLRAENFVLEDIVIYTKKPNARTSVALSSDFDENAINWDYCKENNIEVSRSKIKYGQYSSVLSIPGSTLTIVTPFIYEPLDVCRERNMFNDLTFNEILTHILNQYGEVSQENNDLIIKRRKFAGSMFIPRAQQRIFIMSLLTFDEKIDKIYSENFKELSQKKLPSERSIGFNNLSGLNLDVRGFAELLIEKTKELAGIDIEGIVEVDGD